MPPVARLAVLRDEVARFEMKLAILTTDNREHERAYLEPLPRFCTAPQSLLPTLCADGKVEVHIVSCAQRPMQSPAKLAPHIWYHGLYVPKLGWLRTLYQGCIRATRKKLREIQPDLVHGMGTERDCSISAVLSGFPNVVTIHGNMAELARQERARLGSYLWLTARLENFTLRRTMGVLCNSTYTEGLVRSRARRTWLAPHALRPAFLDPSPAVGPRSCSLLVAGVISPRKRQLEILDMVETLRSQGLRVEFRFIGFTYTETPYIRAFRERLKPLEAAGYARYLGAPPDDELVRHFDAVSGMVHFPTEEAFGNVVCEALARDLKFFGARLGGIVDIATKAPGAELFDRDDWPGLTAAIARWIREGHPRPTNAAALMRQHYHPEVVARHHLEIYAEVLKTHRPS